MNIRIPYFALFRLPVFGGFRFLRWIFSCLCLIQAGAGLYGQVGFNVDDLVTNLTSPTSLEFGPDGRLYVSQQNGTLSVYSISRIGVGDYQVDSSEVILDVKNDVPNHNDDGTFNSTQKRQITGILVAGTSTNPVLYVSSSDWRIKVGSDGNLDTNSGVISRLTWIGTDISDPGGYWDKVDIVRGLPRSEENHATNGMDLDEAAGILYVMSGGNCNKGVPSNNFGGTPEYALSAALLTVDLDSINNMPVFVDPRTNTKFVYDLPTLDDPGRVNIGNSHPDFPYAASHPMYNDSIDPGDPFGGNNGLNQAMWVQNGPVQVYSPGYRNAYDVVLTDAGRLYTFDNGPNGGWGGLPLVYDAGGTPKGTGPWAPGDYITNELFEGSSTGHGDGLHYISGPGYYGGYPNPTRANPANAGLYYYIYDGSAWVADSVYDFFTDFPAPPVPLALQNPIEADYQAPSNALMVINSSTNGLTEYRSSNFSGALQGNLLAVAFNDNVYSIELDASGSTVVNSSILLNGFGNNPLDVTALGDNDTFPGTIWVALHGDDKITVFEPTDYSPFSCDSTYSTLIDSDGDGYSNADELDNGTNPCSQGSKPDDYDMDFLSNLSDPDDDNDGIPDTYDPFAVDPTNGLTADLPIHYSFSINGDDAIENSLFGLGFTGLVTNGDPETNTPGTDYLNLFAEDSLNLGGATSKFGIENIGVGTASLGTNTQENGFQFGIHVDSSSSPFTIISRLESPFFLVNGTPSAPTADQAQGIMFGKGDQDHFIQLVVRSVNGSTGLGLFVEDGAVQTSTLFDSATVGDILSGISIDLYLSIDPSAGTVLPRISTDGGQTTQTLGVPVSFPKSWLSLDDSLGLAVGIISTSAGSSQKFDATWDFISVLYQEPVSLGIPDQAGVADGSKDSLDLTVYSNDDLGVGGLQYQVIPLSSNVVTPVLDGTQIEWTYPSSGTGIDTVRVVITDQDGYTVSDTFLITVSEPITVLYRVNAGGSSVSSLDPPNGDWQEDSQSNASPYRNTGSNVNGYNVTTVTASVPATTPLSIFQSERWDKKALPEMEWDFPVSGSGSYEVRLYFADGYSGTSSPGDRIFDVEIEGVTVLANYDIVADAGFLTGTMKSFIVAVSDGNLDLNFQVGPKSLPIINGIEILGSASPPGPTKLLSATASSIHFFSTEVDSTSSPLPDTLVNSGNSDLTISAVSLTGADAAEFASSLTTPLVIPAGGTQPFTVTFSPASSGSKSASLEITHDGDNSSPLTIALTGEAVNNGNQPPVSALGNRADTINTVISIAGSSYASDPDGDMLQFSSVGLSNIGLSISPTTGDITGTLVSVPGDYPVSIKVVDNGSPADSVTENITWTITNQLLQGQWTNLPSSDGSVPVERGEADYVEANGEFFLIGGRGINVVSIYDPILDVWTAGATPPKQLHHFQAVAYDGKIWIIGAMTGSYPNESPVDSIYIYDPVLDSWSTGGEIPSGRRRGSGGTIVYNNEIYWVGGIINGHLSGHVDWTDKFTPTTSTWSTLADAPRARDHFRAVEEGGKIYLAGGRRTDAGSGSVYANTVAEVDIYDIATNSWSTFVDTLPTARAGAMGAAFQGQILVLGGESINQTIAHNEVEALDPSTGKWESLPPMITGRHGTGAIIYNSRIYVAGGVGNRGGNPKLTTQEYYQLQGSPVFSASALTLAIKQESGSAILTWEAALEGRTEKFLIQRSTDGVEFETIGTDYPALGVLGQYQSSFLDENPASGRTYYRIRQVYTDGTFVLSDIRSLWISSDRLVIAPNPVLQGESSFVRGEFPDGGQLSLYDPNGSLVWEMSVSASRQEQILRIDTHQLARGVYLVQLIRDGQSVHRKLLIR